MNKSVLFPYYIVGEIVPFDEDHFHEFKGHRSLCVEEIPPNCLKTKTPSVDPNHRDHTVVEHNPRLFRRPFHSSQSRQAVSKTLNGFLNTGKGGIVYLGITDDGVVRGIQLTDNQKEHVEQSLEDLMQRYQPSVPPERYNVRFVPVVEKDEDISEKMETYQQKDPKKTKMSDTHLLRTHEKCWCDIDAQARLAYGIIPVMYVIEITIEKFVRPEIDYDTLCYDFYKYFHTIYETEEGECYFRRQASINVYTKHHIYVMSLQESKEFCLDVIEKLSQKKRELEWKQK